MRTTNLALLLASTKALTTQNVVDILEGAMVGALNAEELPDYAKCVTETGDAIHQIEDAVAHFEKKTVTDVYEGIQELSIAMRDFANDVKDCGNDDDKHKAEMIIEMFKKIGANPKNWFIHVGKDILINGVPIWNDLSDAVSQYKTGGYEKFGEDVGGAIALALIGQTPNL